MSQYRRMFPGARIASRPVDANAEHARLQSLANAMASGAGRPGVPEPVNPSVPAAYTYLGQFIAHDVSWVAPGSSFDAPDGLVNRRTPELDLDSLYGAGPIEDPALYDGGGGRPDAAYRFRLGHAFFDHGEQNVAELDLPRVTRRYADVDVDLQPNGGRSCGVSVLDGSGTGRTRRAEVPATDVVFLHGRPRVLLHEANVVRTRQGFAYADPAGVHALGFEPLIADPRNDDNVVVSQLHLAFLRFHNAVLDDVRAAHPGWSSRAVFEETRKLVRWHYQWLVVRDYLPRILGQAACADWCGRELDLSAAAFAYEWRSSGPYVPLEFAFAAFRFGHASVRTSYVLNHRIGPVPTFVDVAAGHPKADLRGRRILPEVWSVQWGSLLGHAAGAGNTLAPQFSRSLSEHLALPMSGHMVPHGDGQETLPFITLLRGSTLPLPSGQEAARADDLTPLSGAEQPLWLYVLREAREVGGGHCLGPLGASIVARTLLGIVREDTASYLHAREGGRPWTPTLGRTPGEFDLEDLLVRAGAPIMDAELDVAVFGGPPPSP